MNLETLKLLADDGSPLALTTERIGDKIWVTREGRGQTAITIGSYASAEWALEGLRNALAHYPRPATIDGERLETTPAPSAARVTVLDPRGTDISESREEEFPLDESPEAQPIGNRYNAMVAGVRCSIKTDLPQWERDESVHLSRGEENWGRNHGPLRVVKLEAHTEVTAEEIREMGVDWNQPSVPTGSRLEQKTRERRGEMRQRTQGLPGIPARYEGEIYLYPLTGEMGSAWFEPAPIWVDGQPVEVEQPQEVMTDAEWLSVVDALMQDSSEMVPITTQNTRLMGACIRPSKKVTTVVRVETTTEPEREKNGEVAEIRFKLELETPEGESQARTVMGRMLLEGEYEEEMTWRVVQADISRDELQDILIRALWQDHDDDSLDENRYQYDLLQERIGHLATHILGDPVGAIREEMQNRADRIHPSVPLPDETVEVTSGDGRWTLRLNRPQETRQEAETEEAA